MARHTLCARGRRASDPLTETVNTHTFPKLVYIAAEGGFLLKSFDIQHQFYEMEIK